MEQTPAEGAVPAAPARHKHLKRLGLAGAGLAVGLMIAPATVEAAVNYFDTTVTASGTGSVNCPAGTRLTGGGAGPLPSDSFSTNSSSEYQLTGSYPSGNAWRATATVVRGTFSKPSGWAFRTGSYNPKVYVICAK